MATDAAAASARAARRVDTMDSEGRPSEKSAPVAYTTVGTVHPPRLATTDRPPVSRER